ncbi:MAG: hypothetical protein ACK41C_07870 [Phenylobacterium sp.]|uniref:hypothetical protein n=1 Tax=Phenylobacterium sp. TaxID=1871053 RepID=UPI00391CB5C8
MPNVTRLPAPRRPRPEPLFLFDARRPTQAASADMIEQVITHADTAMRMSGGRCKYRVSAQTVERLIAEGRLEASARRLADLTVIWDETEGQVATVRDDARLRDAAARWAEWDALWDEESFAPEPMTRSFAA